MPFFFYRAIFSTAFVVTVCCTSRFPASAGDVLATPVHGAVLEQRDASRAVVQLDEVPQMQPATTKQFLLDPAQRLKSGTHIDALEHADVLGDITPSDGYNRPAFRIAAPSPRWSPETRFPRCRWWINAAEYSISQKRGLEKLWC